MSYQKETVICDICQKPYERFKKSTSIIGKIRKGCSPKCRKQLSEWSNITHL